MSKLQRIRAGLARLLAIMGNVTTDKGVLAWDGDEDLKAGDKVYIEDQDGNRTDAADGDYRTEDGKTIVVVEGVVAEIRDPEAEVAPQNEEPVDVNARRASHFARIREAFDESYDEKARKIAGALSEKLGDENFWIEEAADTYVVVDLWSEEDYERHYRRYPVSWDEAGTPTIGDGEDVKLMFVPLDYESPFEGTGAEDIEAMRQENAELKARLEELRKQPAAKPAHEEVKAAAEVVRTGNKGLDRLAAMMGK